MLNQKSKSDNLFSAPSESIVQYPIQESSKSDTPQWMDDILEGVNLESLDIDTAPVPLFFRGLPKKNQKLFNVDKMFTWDKRSVVSKNEDGETVYNDISYVDTEDTEWYGKPSEILKQVSRTGLSTQVKGIHPTAPKKMFWHPVHAKELNEARVRVDIPPLNIAMSEGHFIEYLKTCGVDAKISKVNANEDLEKLPVFSYTMNAHFATAELLMVFSGGLREEIKEFVKKGYIIARRLLKIERRISETLCEDFVEFSTRVVEIEGIRYRLHLRVIDTCAIHGIEGYAGIAANVGHELKHKDKIDKKDKCKMLDVALKNPGDFEDYALGDLDVYDILTMYNAKWMEVYAILGLEEYYREPALTIGASVRDLLVAALANHFHIGVRDEKGRFKWKEDFDNRLKPLLQFNATEIRDWVKSTSVLLCKVEGGRCRNNRPKSSFIRRKTTKGYDVVYEQNVIIDIDIASCYGEGQRNQMFFLGKPSVLELDLKLDKERYNQYPSLREVLKDLGVNTDILTRQNPVDWENLENWGELVPGGWTFRFSAEDLKYGQDFFASWVTSTGYKTNIMAKFIKEQLSTDSELTDKIQSVDFDEKYGITKIFEKEIYNGILTHDGLQWILAIASARQRNDLLDKIKITTGAYYPRSMEFKPTSPETAIDELNGFYDNWQGKNTFKITNAKTGATQQNYESCHAWLGVNLGGLIVNKLLIERKKAKILSGKKSPLDQLFKLCVNTLYGDIVSPYFIISNPIVGNNITARARSLAWYMEKGFNGFPTVTDGCPLLANACLFPGRDSINGELINSNRDKKIRSRLINQKPLGGVDEILSKGNEVFIRTGNQITSIGIDDQNAWINEKGIEHLQNLFPCVDVLHKETTKLDIDKNTLEPTFSPRIGQFGFEAKAAHHEAAFHGASNYIFIKYVQKPTDDGDKKTTKEVKETIIKMRGYEVGKAHESYNLGLDPDEDPEDYEGKETYITSDMRSDRYNENNSPGEDFMRQLLENPEAIRRQEIGVKDQILKVGEYVENSTKYDDLGLVPGDTVKKSFLMQEFSLSQFTFKTYTQYMSWLKIITTDKNSRKQSIETFFLNSDGTLNFVKMTEWVADAIDRGVMNPYEELDKSNHKSRDKQTTHPSLEDYKKIANALNKGVNETVSKTTKVKPKSTLKTEKVLKEKDDGKGFKKCNVPKKPDKKTKLKLFEHYSPLE